MITTENATLRAELLVSRWHKDFRLFLGAGIDWQARVGLVNAIVELLQEVAGEPVADAAGAGAEVIEPSQRRARAARGLDLEA
jgi:hypothetical protein